MGPSKGGTTGDAPTRLAAATDPPPAAGQTARRASGTRPRPGRGFDLQAGYGAVQKSLAGAGVADSEDATAIAINPAGLVDVGKRASSRQERLRAITIFFLFRPLPIASLLTANHLWASLFMGMGGLAVMPLTYLHSLIGGALIGLASSLYLLLDGRIAGVSGIIGGSLRPTGENQLRNLSFLFGLFLGPVIYRLGFGGWPMVHFQSGYWVFALAGLFVGFGTGLGSGCTSGHGVCGWRAFREDRSLRSQHFFPSG
jgi:hypothetical protein